MKVKFFTDDGTRIDEDGGAEFRDQAAAEQEALLGMADWLREIKAEHLPLKAAVIACDAEGRPIFRLRLTVTVNRFDGAHAESAVE